MNSKIFLIHGFCGMPITLLPIKWALQKRGYKYVYTVSYSSILSLEKATNSVLKQIKNIVCSNNKIILIGYSFGGIISYYISKILKIYLMILIASPLKSCIFLKKINYYLPFFITNFAKKIIPPLNDLLIDKNIDITIPYYTITTNLFCTNDFDGKIYLDDAIIDKNKNIKIINSSHALLLINPICFQKICELLDNHCTKISCADGFIKIDFV